MAAKSFEDGPYRYICKDLYAVRYNGRLGRFWEIRALEDGAWILYGTQFFKNSATRKEIAQWVPK